MVWYILCPPVAPTYLVIFIVIEFGQCISRREQNAGVHLVRAQHEKSLPPFASDLRSAVLVVTRDGHVGFKVILVRVTFG